MIEHGTQSFGGLYDIAEAAGYLGHGRTVLSSILATIKLRVLSPQVYPC